MRQYKWRSFRLDATVMVVNETYKPVTSKMAEVSFMVINK